MDVTCPQGHQQVRKVSGIYKEQGRLSPPEEPTQERLLPANSMHIPIIHVGGHVIGYPMTIGLTFLFGIFACGSIEVGGTAGAGTGVFLFILGIALITGLIIWKGRTTAAARRAVFEDEYPRWQRAYRRWDQLYYCQVCDGLYVPNGGSPLMTEEEAGQFLYAD